MSWTKIWSAQLVLFSPGLVTIVGADGTRLIYTDSRGHPSNVKPTYQGHSIGHWDPDGVLVVDTIALEASNPLIMGIPQGKGVHVVERIQAKAGILYQAVSIEAPKFSRSRGLSRRNTSAAASP